MKKIIFLLFIMLMINISINVFGQRQPYKSTPLITPDFNMIMQAMSTMEARYNQNKNYRDKLIDWILELKTKTTENLFIDNMNFYYNQLRAMDNQDFGILGDKLDIIRQNILQEIDFYNTRLNKEIERQENEAKEAPNKLWQSGNNNLKNGEFLKAIQDYSDLIILSPDFIYVYKQRGIAYQMLEKFSLSISDLNKYIESKADDPSAYYDRGWSKYKTNDFNGAMNDFNKLIEIEPSSASAYYSRGSAKSELSDEEGSIKDYFKAVELEPKFSMAYNNIGWAKFKQKKYNEALTYLKKAILLDSTNWVAYDSRQETKFAINDFKGCIEDCNIAIRLNPECTNSYFIRGRAYFKSGNKKKACEDWNKAGELGKAEAYEYISKYCK
jgi:tetratricopeptide (TPR) repeat protein